MMTSFTPGGKVVTSLSPRVVELLTMLTYRRPDASQSEADFIARYLDPLGCLPDEFGNRWLTVGEDGPILWSCHTDTVHKKDGKQRVLYGQDGLASVAKGNCLGADCTVGVWLMVNMIRAGVSGTYVFHRAEEVGGRGSAHIAGRCADRLRGLRFAIAFDRKGYDEIITHQAMGRTASDAFAMSLADALLPLRYVPSDGGTFTDTANYADIIPECTNISVGYHKQHRSDEWLDVRFAERLLDALVAADFSGLVCERNPDDRWDDLPWWRESEPPRRAAGTMEGYVKRYSAEVAAFLEAQGFTQDDIETWLWDQYEPR